MGVMEQNIYRNGYQETRKFWGTLKLFSVWKGSVFRILWSEIIVYITLYYSLSLLYRSAIIPSLRQPPVDSTVQGVSQFL